MNREKLHHLRSSIIDTMVYISAYAPDFPAEDATSLQQQHDALACLITQHRDTLRSAEQATWHRVAEQEIAAAFQAFSSGDKDRGSDQMQRAGEHLRRSFKPKRIRPDFLIAPDGKTFQT